MIELRVQGVRAIVLEGDHIDGPAAEGEARAFITKLICEIERAKAFAASRLLSVYNRAWIDERNPPLSPEGFIGRMRISTIVLYDRRGVAELRFSDGDMFGGHDICVFYDDGTPCHADIHG